MSKLGYSKDIFESVSRKLEKFRRDARMENEEKVKKFYMMFPRAKEIDRLLSKTAICAAKSILNGAGAKEQLEKLKISNQKLQFELSSILIEANLPRDYLQIKYRCERCCDTGYVNGMMCTCMKKLLKHEAYDKLNRLSPLSLSTFDCFSLEYYSDLPAREGGISPRKRMKDILNFCINYAENFSLKSSSLLMQGATGLGKTHLSLAIANDVINKGYGVIYGSAPNIIMKLEKERFTYGTEKIYSDSESYLIDCDLLILDDIGTEFATSFSSSAIYNIINSRIMEYKPTIISTNFSIRDLECAYSSRLVSRIMGNHLRLEFLGGDVRQVKRKLNKRQSKFN